MGQVLRPALALMTFGTSELAQKKPFQNLGKDEPVGQKSSLLRFIPAGGATIGAAAAGAGLDAPIPKLPAVTKAPKPEDTAVQMAASDAARRRQRGRGFRSTILGGLIGSRLAAPTGLKETLGS